MNKEEYWKNFSLLTEIDIAGTFVYNGLRRFHEMETFYVESDVFEVLYNLSVGIERLLKISVILIEHDTVEEQDTFEQSLITHNHMELVRRIKGNRELEFASPYNEFIHLLSKFYRTHRYGRYSIQSVFKSPERDLFCQYFEKHLSIVIKNNFPFDITPVDSRMRKFLGRRVGKICERLFTLIENDATRLGIFTSDLRTDSRAEKIFRAKSYDFYREDELWKELLIFILRFKGESGMLDFIKNIEPLDFDIGLINEYLACFGSHEARLSVLDEFEYLSENADRKIRNQQLEVIGKSSVEFDEDESCDE